MNISLPDRVLLFPQIDLPDTHQRRRLQSTNYYHLERHLLSHNVPTEYALRIRFTSTRTFYFYSEWFNSRYSGGRVHALRRSLFPRTCPEIIDSFYSGSGPGYTKFIQLQSGQCCLYNLRQNCDKVGSDLRLIVDQIIDSDCLQLFNVKQSSSKHGHSVNTTFFLVVGSIVLLSLLRIF